MDYIFCGRDTDQSLLCACLCAQVASLQRSTLHISNWKKKKTFCLFFSFFIKQKMKKKMETNVTIKSLLRPARTLRRHPYTHLKFSSRVQTWGRIQKKKWSGWPLIWWQQGWVWLADVNPPPPELPTYSDRRSAGRLKARPSLRRRQAAFPVTLSLSWFWRGQRSTFQRGTKWLFFKEHNPQHLVLPQSHVATLDLNQQITAECQAKIRKRHFPTLNVFLSNDRQPRERRSIRASNS